MKNIIKVFVFCVLVVGVIYPVGLFIIGKVFFENKINGSLAYKNGQVVGSYLLAQEFKNNKYFHPRFSSINYDPMSSGASNLGPISKTLKAQVDERKQANLSDEMLFNSGSGLDPHISLNTALKQVEMVSIERKLNSEQKEKVIKLVYQNVEKGNAYMFGSELVNVLKLNMQLDEAGLN